MKIMRAAMDRCNSNRPQNPGDREAQALDTSITIWDRYLSPMAAAPWLVAGDAFVSVVIVPILEVIFMTQTTVYCPLWLGYMPVLGLQSVLLLYW